MIGPIPLARILWKPCFRIIPSRFPPIQLFERVADPADLEAIIELETMTNPRLRNEIGEIRLVPPQERVSGPGSNIIMAAFTHLNPEGSRFSNGSYGVFYAARDLQTAIAETVYHAERFMRATRQPRQELDRRVYLVDLKGELADPRGRQGDLTEAYHLGDYTGGQRLADRLKREGADGIVYDSVRRKNGECAALFRPKRLSRCRQERHLCYIWDGRRIADVYEKREMPRYP